MKKEIDYTYNILADDDEMHITEIDLLSEEKYGSSTQDIPASEPKKKTNKKKPREEKKVTTEEKDDNWNCHLSLPNTMYQQVKLISILECISIQQVMKEALTMYFKSKKTKLIAFLSSKIED